MLKDYFSVVELVEILGIDEVSAVEILNSTIELEAHELIVLSEYKGLNTDSLLK